MSENRGSPKITDMQADELVVELMQAQKNNDLVYKLHDKNVVGKLDLSNRTIDIAVDIQHCEFRGEVDLNYCEFKQAVNFSRCTFHQAFLAGDENRSRTIFRKDFICNSAVFIKAARLRGVRCEGGALFRRTCFQSGHEKADFSGAYFEKSLVCDKAVYCGGASFNAIKCGVDSSFRVARFMNEKKLVDFTAASFKYLDCSGAAFKGPVAFNIVDCDGHANFWKARFWNETELVDFTSASFKRLFCSSVIFKGPVSFNSVECTISAYFRSTKFENDRHRLPWVPASVDFSFASLNYLNCSDAIFRGPVSFNGIKCTDDAIFCGTQFLRAEESNSGVVDFSLAHFGSSLVWSLDDSGRAVRFEREVWLERTKVLNILDLTGTKFKDRASFLGTTIGTLVFMGPCFEKGLDLRNCTFKSLGDPAQAEMLKKLLVAQNPWQFSRDPYIQIENYYNSIGDEAKAKKTYYEGRRDDRKNAKKRTPKLNWYFGRSVPDWMLKWLAGYGVQTWRLFLGALIFIGIGTLMFWSDNRLVEVEASASSAAPGGTLVASTSSAGEQSSYAWEHKLVDRFTYSLDLFLPVVNLGVDERWEPNGWWPQKYALVHVFVGWLLVPLLVASLAGILRRP